jgi:hypothetical protein
VAACYPQSDAHPRTNNLLDVKFLSVFSLTIKAKQNPNRMILPMRPPKRTPSATMQNHSMRNFSDTPLKHNEGEASPYAYTYEFSGKSDAENMNFPSTFSGFPGILH